MRKTKRAAGYRLNWNPERAPDDITAAHVRRVETHGAVKRFWRCGNAAIEPGDPVYLVRTGRELRGIIGAGVAIDEPEGGYVNNDGEWIPRAVQVEFHLLSLTPFIPREELDQPPFDQVRSWSNATAAGRLPAAVVAAIESRLPAHPRGQHVATVVKDGPPSLSRSDAS